MATSYNGWSASPDRNAIGIVPLVVAGEPFSPGVRGGAVHTVLRYVAEQLNKRVEPIVRSDWHQADDWGYAYRANVNNPSQLSCHASGTAIDYNATRHPNGKRGTWTAAQKAEINKILAEVNNVVRNLAHDEMHFEIAGNAAQVAAAAAKVAGGSTGTPADPNDDILELGDSGLAVKALQETLNRWYPTLPQLVVDGDFGQATKDRVIHYQRAAGLTPDGEVGPATRAGLGLKPPREYVAPPEPPREPRINPDGGIAHFYGNLTQEVKDRLGKLTSDEEPLDNEGIGYIARYEGGQIFWKTGLGAHYVWGAIFEAYGAHQWEHGPLGYPITNEFTVELLDGDGVLRKKAISVFEHGSIFFDFESGSIAVFL